MELESKKYGGLLAFVERFKTGVMPVIAKPHLDPSRRSADPTPDNR